MPIIYAQTPGGDGSDTGGGEVTQPGEPGSSTEEHSFVINKVALQAICDSIGKYTTGGEQEAYNAYFAAVKSSSEYSEAQTYLDEDWPEAVEVTDPGEPGQSPTDAELEEMESGYQATVDALALSLTKAYKKAPFEYVKSQVSTWHANYYGVANGGNGDYTAQEWQALYDESDYALIAMQADEVLAAYSGREEEITYEEIWRKKAAGDGTEDPGTSEEEIMDGIIPLTEDLLGDQATSYKNKVLELKNLLQMIAGDETGKYDELKASSIYTTPYAWFSSEDWGITGTESPEENFSFDQNTHNQTAVSVSIDRLNTMVSFVDVLYAYHSSADDARTEVNTYFAEDERTDSNADYKAANDVIAAFETLLENPSYNAETGQYVCGGQAYASLEALTEALNEVQAEVQGIPQTLEEKQAAYEQTLRDLIATAQKLSTHLSTAESGKDALLEAITAATTAANNSTKQLSNYTDATAALQTAYDTAKAAYDELAEALGQAIGNATTQNSTWQDSELATAIQTAQTVMENAGNVEAMDTDISTAMANITAAMDAAEARFGMKSVAEQLKACQALYGDADGSMQALVDESATTTALDAVRSLTQRMQEKIDAVEAAYEEAKAQLQDRIADSKRYYENWKDTRDMEALKEAYEEAETVYAANTTEQVRDIAALQEAYVALDAVYADLGGYSDPYEARQELIELIAEAEVYWEKYQYNDLRNAINEANRNVNSDTRYVLNQQIANLQAAMDNAVLQYTTIMSRLEAQYPVTEAKMKERYGDDPSEWPEEDRTFMETVKADMQPSETSEGEFVCTNVPVLQGYYRDLQSMVAEADALWDAAVEAFYNAIQEADLLFTSSYPDDEALGAAIAHAEEEYAKIAESYLTIASVEALQEALAQEVARVETADRRGVANQFIRLYVELNNAFGQYGSDENTPNTSDVKTYLAENQAVYEELNSLSGTDLIEYTLPELMAFVEEATAVQERYQMFCSAVDALDATIESAETSNGQYYEDRPTDNNLYRTIEKAIWAKEESFNQDSVESWNYALRDTLSQTALLYRSTLQKMNSARSAARNKHIIYYGSATEESEIMDSYNKAEAYLEDLCLTRIEKMTLELDTCYYHAQDSCAVLETEIQQVIDEAERLNTLMQDSDFDLSIAQAINARYSNDGRIAAIRAAIETLQAACAVQEEAYAAAAAALEEALADARQLLGNLADDALQAAIASAEAVAAKADLALADAATCAAITEACDSLMAEQARVESLLDGLLAEALQALQEARDEAFARNTLYYGAGSTDNEIMKVYNEAEAYLDSGNLEDIALMTDSVNNSYVEAAVRCLQLEAEVDNLARKASPLATLMEDDELAAMITEATASRNVSEARIPAMEAVLPELQALYETDSALYDEAVVDLNDSVATARTLLLQRYDVALETAIAEAETALDNAGKTSASCTMYADLVLQTGQLAQEMERVRQAIEASSIDAVQAGDREVEVYTIEGYLVKRVRLSDPDAFRFLPEGIYIVDGKKMFLPKR